MKIKEIKIREDDGSYSDAIPVGADAANVDYNDTTVKAELDKLNNDNNIDKNNITNLQAQVSSLASGGPAGVYETVAALISADPDHSKIYVVTEDGHWYYYNNGWQDGGNYLTEPLNTSFIDILNNSVYNINDELGIGTWNNIDVNNMSNGFYTSTIGEIATLVGSSPWHSIIIDNINSGDRFKIDLRIQHVSTYGIIWVDSSNIVLSRDLQGASSLIAYDNYISIAPPRASKLILCTYYTNDGAKKLSLSKYSENYNNTVIDKIINRSNIMNYIYVATDGSDENGDGTINNPYRTLYYANETITDNSKTNKYTIIVKNGTYTDLQTKYSGTYSGTYEGVICKDYVYYESENILRPDLTVISWNGATGFTIPVTETQIVDKCPFHITKESLHTHIKGFTITCVNTRYAMHIEMAEANGASEWIIENCIFNWGGRPDQTNYVTTAMIGCGTSFFEEGYIKNCQFNCTETGDTAFRNWLIIQTHDNNLNPSTALKVGEKLTIENCNITQANNVHTSAMFNFRCTHQANYDIVPVVKFINITGYPIYLNLEGNINYQKYNVILEATDSSENT